MVHGLQHLWIYTVRSTCQVKSAKGEVMGSGGPGSPETPGQLGEHRKMPSGPSRVPAAQGALLTPSLLRRLQHRATTPLLLQLPGPGHMWAKGDPMNWRLFGLTNGSSALSPPPQK